MQQEEPLLLGILDAEISEDVDWSVNKVGGLPDWIHPLPNPCCKSCGAHMTLVCQLYCPLGGSSYHRVLYIFVCANKQCWNKSDSWTVSRSQLQDKCFGASCLTSNENSCDIGIAEPSDATNGGNSKGKAEHTELDEWGLNTDWDDEGDITTNTIAMVTAQFQDVTLQSGALFHHNTSEKFTSKEMPNEMNNSSHMNPCNTSNSEAELANVLDKNAEDESENRFGNQNDIVTPEDCFIAAEGGCNLLIQNPKTDLATDILQSEAASEKMGDKSSENMSSVTFESYFVDVFEEPENSVPSLKHEQQLLKDYARREGVNLTDLMDDRFSASSQGNERYEKTELKHGDKTFHKFLKKVSTCPHQILRYQYNGCPLYISAPDNLPEVPRCEYCGSKRIFELQLMPALVTSLKVDGNTGASIEFGSVYIYTCMKSCWTEYHPVQEEYIFIQPDPDTRFFKV